jgi:2-methylcitrate dehydratase PrpD
MTSYSLTEQLAKHLQRPVDQDTRERARLHLLDWLACVAGARNSELVQKFRTSDMSDMSPHLAAMAGNILEMDDIHRTSILHPGPVVWGALMVGQPNDMDNVLDAAVRGYEAMIAIGSTFDAHHYAHYHNTSTAGVFGAAAAVADLYGCDEGQLVSALGLAGSVAGGLWQMRHEANDAKQWHVERAMVNGGSAGLYAAQGIIGPRFILEGAQGLYAATCKKPKPMAFPNQWRIWDVSFKPWGACRHAHPVIDAALELKGKLGKLTGPITLETYGDAIRFCDRPSPETVHEAKFSLQHAVAVVAERGEPMLADFEMDSVKALKKARGRVSVVESKAITKRYPDHYGARVTCGGEAVELIDTRGDPERPLSTEGVIEKAHALMAWGGLSKKQAGKAVLHALEGDDPVKTARMVGKWLA